MKDKKQAIIVVHGMGEQRPVETLNGFSAVIANGATVYSRSAGVPGEFESRKHVIPKKADAPENAHARNMGGFDVQTDIYEYHWAHLMTGNRLNDLWPTFRRVMLPVTGAKQTALAVLLLGVFVAALSVAVNPWPPGTPAWLPVAGFAAAVLVALVVGGIAVRNVPHGLRGLWVILWLAVVGLLVLFLAYPAVLADALSIPTPVQVLAGSVSAIAIVAYVISRLLPGWLVKNMVDVVRYLDTSPRSYEVRRQIRAGIIDLIKTLQDSGEYSRVVVAAHSLGSYIAYDAISYLWSECFAKGVLAREDLLEIERLASGLDAAWTKAKKNERAHWARLHAGEIEAYRAAQRRLWCSLRRAGHPWLITDFVSFGSPMNFADMIYTTGRAQFEERVAKRELVTCPPITETTPSHNVNEQGVYFSWAFNGHENDRRLHEAAAFAPVRWTNLWYPAEFSFFGDWFGGPLGPLYGPGIKDVELVGDLPRRRIPGYAHAAYLRTNDHESAGSFAYELDQALDLDAESWLPEPPVRSRWGTAEYTGDLGYPIGRPAAARRRTVARTPAAGTRGSAAAAGRRSRTVRPKAAASPRRAVVEDGA